MARGGMGEIFLALAGETQGYEKLCVVKKILGSVDDEGVRRRFLDEARVVVRLNHSNLVQVFDAGLVGDEHFRARELVEGKDLRAVWNRCAQLHRRIPIDFAMFLAREVCRGLDYAHEAMSLELVHRDISPPNILIGYHGEIKVTDFGLAKHVNKREHTNPGVVFGRYSYLAPEQARGQGADRRTDIYATGIILWEMLTGRQLFPVDPRAGPQASIAALRNPKIPAPSSIVPGIPEGLDRVVLTALAVERDDRYSTALQFRADLSEMLARHAPACDVDRVAAFMRDVFARERKFDSLEYEELRQADYSTLRQEAQKRPAKKTISVTDIDELRTAGSGAMELGDSDVIELRTATRQPGSLPTHAELHDAAKQRIGQVIAGRYRVERVLGTGGMGAVYEVTHLGLGRTLAVKVLHEAFGRDADLIDRFMREARAASQTGHPNIIDVVDVGTTDVGDPYFVMELIHGTDLGSLIDSGGAIAPSRAVHIAQQICRAVGAAHEAGIIHRDLKSDNVMLVEREKDPDFVKVLDFGICKVTDGAGEGSRTRPGIVMGSPDFMAPEQAVGIDASVASDVYALGTIVFHMVTGRVPFYGRNSIDVLVQKGAKPAPRIRDIVPDLPAALDEVVAQCLEREPNLRPASMRDVEYQLTRALEGRARAVAMVMGLDLPDVDPPPRVAAMRAGPAMAAAAAPSPPAETFRTTKQGGVLNSLASLARGNARSLGADGEQLADPAQISNASLLMSDPQVPAGSLTGVTRGGAAAESLAAVQRSAQDPLTSASTRGPSGAGAEPAANSSGTMAPLRGTRTATASQPEVPPQGSRGIRAGLTALLFVGLGVSLALVVVFATAVAGIGPLAPLVAANRDSAGAPIGRSPANGKSGGVSSSDPKGAGTIDAPLQPTTNTGGSPSERETTGSSDSNGAEGAATGEAVVAPNDTGAAADGDPGLDDDSAIGATGGEDVGDQADVVAGLPDTASELSALAQVAFDDKKWREPATESLALILVKLSLIEPGHEAIKRLRRAATVELLEPARKLASRKSWNDAATMYRDLLAVVPDHKDARAEFLEVLRHVALRKRKQGEHELVLSIADEMLLFDEGDFAALELRASALYALGRWEEAVPALRAVLKRRPRDSATKAKYKRALGKLGK